MLGPSHRLASRGMAPAKRFDLPNWAGQFYKVWIPRSFFTTAVFCLFFFLSYLTLAPMVGLDATAVLSSKTVQSQNCLLQKAVDRYFLYVRIMHRLPLSAALTPHYAIVDRGAFTAPS